MPKSNPLLVKSQLGTVKSTSYDLPTDFQFTYGMRQVQRFFVAFPLLCC